jgi:hypothetical protein
MILCSSIIPKAWLHTGKWKKLFTSITSLLKHLFVPLWLSIVPVVQVCDATGVS